MTVDVAARRRDSDRFMLALVLWRESRGEPVDVRIAVGHSILNRVAKPSWWGRTVLAVLRKKWQYSSMTDPHDAQLTTWPEDTDGSWYECLQVALELLGPTPPKNSVPGADSYYDISLDKIGKAPNWIAAARFCGQIGRIKFYDVDHDYEAEAA